MGPMRSFLPGFRRSRLQFSGRCPKPILALGERGQANHLSLPDAGRGILELPLWSFVWLSLAFRERHRSLTHPASCFTSVGISTYSPSTVGFSKYFILT